MSLARLSGLSGLNEMPKLSGSSGAIPAADLVAYWRLEEASGTRADATGRGNDLTPTAAPGNTTGKQGNAVSLVSASAQWLSRADTADLSMGDIDFTITAWVNITSKSGTRVIISKWNGTLTEEYGLDFDTTADRFRFYVENFSKVVSANTLGSPSTSTWYFICAQHDATNNLVKISVNDGAFDTAATAGVFPADRANNFVIGNFRHDNTSSPWNGAIDEVLIMKRLTTSTELTWLYNSGNGRAYSEFV